MPRYTIKHKINNIDHYMHFSGICDAPLTPFLNIDEYKEYYINEYSENDWQEWLNGKRNMEDINYAVMCYNMNISESEQLTDDEFINKFSKENEENGEWLP